MDYTLDCSINEILRSIDRDERTARMFNLVFMRFFLRMMPQELLDKPLRTVQEEFKMPWGVPFPAGDVLDAAELAERELTDPVYRFIPLWAEDTGDYFPNFYPSTDDGVCLMTMKPTPGTQKPVVVICPGGGYETLTIKSEGFDMAKAFTEAGYHAFILTYRRKPNAYPAPHLDLAMAIKYVRAHADEYGIDPENLMVIGSSAGGHLAASFPLVCDEIEPLLMQQLQERDPEAAARFAGISVRPQKLCLCYAVISLLSEHHEGSALALVGEDNAMREKLSVDLHVGSDYPTTFVWACEDDYLVPVSNTTRMGAALEKAGVKHRMEVFPTGGHGCGLAHGTSAASWMPDMLEFMK